MSPDRQPPFRPGERLTADRLNRMISGRKLRLMGDGRIVRATNLHDEAVVGMSPRDIERYLPHNAAQMKITVKGSATYTARVWDGTNYLSPDLTVAPLGSIQDYAVNDIIYAVRAVGGTQESADWIAADQDDTQIASVGDVIYAVRPFGGTAVSDAEWVRVLLENSSYPPGAILHAVRPVGGTGLANIAWATFAGEMLKPICLSDCLGPNPAGLGWQPSIRDHHGKLAGKFIYRDGFDCGGTADAQFQAGACSWPKQFTASTSISYRIKGNISDWDGVGDCSIWRWDGATKTWSMMVGATGGSAGGAPCAMKTFSDSATETLAAGVYWFFFWTSAESGMSFQDMVHEYRLEYNCATDACMWDVTGGCSGCDIDITCSSCDCDECSDCPNDCLPYDCSGECGSCDPTPGCDCDADCGTCDPPATCDADACCDPPGSAGDCECDAHCSCDPECPCECDCDCDCQADCPDTP